MADYVIRSGDTLSQIAQRLGTTVQALAQMNGISNPDLIRAGATLRVPDASGASPQAAARPAGAPAPTTGAVPRPRPQQVAAMDPMAAPLPNARPAAPTPPQPRPNVFAPGGMTLARLQASAELETALQQQQQQERLRMQQQDARMREQAAAMPPAAPQQPSFISPQMESYAAGPAAPREQGIPGARGLPFLSEMPMNDFNNLRLEFANIPASRRQPGMQEAIEAEARRRVDQLRAGVAADERTMTREREAYRNQWGTDPRIAEPQPPVERSIREGQYLPNEMVLLGQLGANMRNAPTAALGSLTSGPPPMGANVIAGQYLPPQNAATLGQLARRPPPQGRPVPYTGV